MTAEEYIQENGGVNNRGCVTTLNMINVSEALKAIKMAREEEQHKAIEAFEGVIIYMISEMEQGRNPKDLKDKFVTLLINDNEEYT